MTKTVIVGGGISGLATAFHLQECGLRDYMLIESAPRWGGKITTVREDGFTIEGGPDSFITQKTAGTELCKRLGLDGPAGWLQQRQGRDGLYMERRAAASDAGGHDADGPDHGDSISALAAVLVAGKAAHGDGGFRSAGARRRGREPGRICAPAIGRGGAEQTCRAADGRHLCGGPGAAQPEEYVSHLSGDGEKIRQPSARNDEAGEAACKARSRDARDAWSEAPADVHDAARRAAAALRCAGGAVAARVSAGRMQRARVSIVMRAGTGST